MYRFCIALSVAVIVIACSSPTEPPPAPAPIKPLSSCGATCSSNIECNNSLIPTCKFCNFGVCRAVRPETPIQDAGADAPGADPGPR